MNIFLYKPEDFQNICTIARNLEAFGVNTCFVYDTHNLIRERYGKSYTRKMRSVSSGAFEKIDFIKVENPIDFLVNHNGRKIATLFSDSELIVDFWFLKDDIIIFGSESSWLPDEIIWIADKKIMIPQKGMTQSLNISHALAIVLYEGIRKESLAGLSF